MNSDSMISNLKSALRSNADLLKVQYEALAVVLGYSAPIVDQLGGQVSALYAAVRFIESIQDVRFAEQMDLTIKMQESTNELVRLNMGNP
jgi:hypothetical protein